MVIPTHNAKVNKMTKVNNINEALDKIIVEQGYEAILSQDGWETLELTLKYRYPELTCSLLMTQMKIRQLDLFEIYVYNDAQINEGVYEGAQPGTVSGWDIQWVLATSEGIKTYPFFDEVITKNDNSTGRRTGAVIWK